MISTKEDNKDGVDYYIQQCQQPKFVLHEPLTCPWRRSIALNTRWSMLSILRSNVQGEPGFSYKVAGWNLEKAGWNEEFQVDIRPIFYKIFYFK
jgi:hypothetical protein